MLLDAVLWRRICGPSSASKPAEERVRVPVAEGRDEHAGGDVDPVQIRYAGSVVSRVRVDREDSAVGDQQRIDFSLGWAPEVPGEQRWCRWGFGHQFSWERRS
jgi:hypothetical protein